VRFLRLPALVEYPPPVVVCDASGVGRGVIELLAEKLIASGVVGLLVSITITSGTAITPPPPEAPGEWHVAKRQLVSYLQAVLQSRRLHIAAGLPEAATLVRELEAFRVKVSEAGVETFESPGATHDDLCIALALGVFVAEVLDVFKPQPLDLPTRLA
jgi:hypothetical protein